MATPIYTYNGYTGYGSGGLPNRTILTGVDALTLQGWLNDALIAYASLMGGSKEVSVSYEGKSVSYRVADGPALIQWIMLLKRALGIPGGRRRPMVPFFR